jgi:hypothetical protein
MNGVQETLTNPTSGSYTAMANTVAPVTIGKYSSSNSFCFDGIIDEVRISKINYTLGRISTEYNNQDDPNSFYTIGTEEADLHYIPPTPEDGENIYTQSALINISSNRNLSECRLAVVNNSINTNSFTISINETMWNKWGFKYPVTYVFDLSNVPSNIEVKYKDTETDPWKTLDKKK